MYVVTARKYSQRNSSKLTNSEKVNDNIEDLFKRSLFMRRIF